MSENLPAILVVDDEFNSRSALEMLVRREGADVVSVSTLVEAESACAARRFAAILVDYYLPDGAGLELVERLGESRPEIVLVTGRSSVEIAVEALRAGVADYLEKPVDPVRLKAVLEAILRTGKFREEIRSLMHEKTRMLATLANAQARRRIQEALEGLSVDAEMKALESVREHIAKLSTEGGLERELGDANLRTRLRAIRDEAREEAARRELSEIKRQLLPEAAVAAP